MQIVHHTWKITGTTPLLQSNPDVMWETPVISKDKAAPDGEEMKTSRRKKPLYPGDSEAFVQAKKGLYVNDDGDLYHPMAAFMHSLWDACPKRVFGKVAALSVIVMAVRTVEEEFLLYDPETLDAKKPKKLRDTKPTKDTKGWLVDNQRGWNKSKDVGIVCIRPKWKSWGGFLTLAMETSVTDAIKGKDNKSVFPGALTELLNVAGALFGIGVGRYRKNGTKGVGMGDKWGGMGTGRFQAELKH